MCAPPTNRSLRSRQAEAGGEPDAPHRAREATDDLPPKKLKPDTELDLPNEVMLHVFSFLALPGLGNAMSVCQHWSTLIATDSALWKAQFNTDYLDIVKHPMSLKKIFHKLEQRHPKYVKPSNSFRHIRLIWDNCLLQRGRPPV